MNRKKNVFLLGLLLLLNAACVDLVEEGIRIDYPLSDANLEVTAIASEMGAVDQTISYEIKVSSALPIKSCIVESSNPGQNGTGYDVSSSGFDDPFADHIFGTLKKEVTDFRVKFDYIIPEGINKSRLTFSIVDESGKVSVERVVEVVPDVARYMGTEIYAKDKNFNDGFASVDGSVYADIKSNYSAVTEANRKVQEKLDILFYYDVNSGRAILAGPASGSLGLSLSIENNTLFKKLPNLNGMELEEVSPESLIKLTENASLLAEGAAQISAIKVGDIIGFITDLNAVYSLKTGLLKVNGLHPANAPHYEGVAYVLECDIVVQK